MDLEEEEMGPEEVEMDPEEVGMDSEEEEMDSEEAVMVLPEPEAVGMEVVGMALPEAVEMVVDSWVVARSLRAVLEVTRVVAVLEKEVVVVVAMLQQPQPQAIVAAAAAAAKEQMEQLETEVVRFQSRLVALL